MNTRKVVINGCHGGFGLSPEALLWLHAEGATGIATPVEEYWAGPDDDGRFGRSRALAQWKAYLASPPTAERFLFLTVFSPDERFVLNGGREMARDDALLLRCLEALGDKADGPCAALRVIEIPADVKWTIEEYDGLEWIAEQHRTWS